MVSQTNHREATIALRRLATVAQDAMGEMSMRAFVVFAAVAEDNDQTVTHYAQVTGFPLQTVSRILQDLTGRPRPGQIAQRTALLERVPNQEDMREVNYRMSPSGRALMLRMITALDSYTLRR